MVLSYSNTFLNMFCGLFLSSFQLKQAGDANYGVYQTMSSFANYLVLLEFGTGTVLARNISACRARQDSKLQIEKNISTIWTITTVLSVLISLVAIGFYFSIDFIYAKSMTAEQIALGKNVFVLMVIFLLSSFCLQTLNGIALAHEHYTYSSSVSIIKILTRTALLIGLMLHFKNVIVIAAVDAAIGIALAVFSFFYCKRSFRIKINYGNFDKLILKASLPLCLALFLQTVVTQSNNIVGKFVLGVMSGPEDVTLYSVGLYIYSIFSSLSTIPVSLYVPQVTKDVTSGLEGLELTKTLVQPCRLIVLVSGSVLFGFVACGRQFISIVYGEAYLLSWVMAIMLMGPMFVNMSNAVALNVLDVKNKRIARSYLLMITTALNIVMTIFGIRYFGIIAAAAATGISTVIQVILMNIYYQKAVDIRVLYLFGKIYKGILPYQIFAATAGSFVGTLISNVYISFIAAGGSYVLIAFGCFLIYGKTAEEANMIKKITSKFIHR